MSLALPLLLIAGCSREPSGGAADQGRPGAAREAWDAWSGPRTLKLLDPARAVWHTRHAPPRRGGRSSDPFRDARQEVERRLLDSRRALELTPGKSFEVEAEIPPGAVLAFDLRLDTSSPGAELAVVEWSWSFRPEGSDERVVRARGRLPVRPPDGGGWRRERILLADLAGERGSLSFSTSAAPGSRLPDDLVVALAAPRLTTPRDTRPSVLFVTVDTLRRDMLGPWGGEAELTPNLNRLADEGVVVERAWSAAPWTLPSYASLFTAEYPTTHGAGLDPAADWSGGAPPMLGIAPELGQLVERFDRAGFTTQAFHDNANLRLGTGAERGFDGYVHYGATGRAAVTDFRDWLSGVGTGPFFCFVHLADVHSPYVPPASYTPPGGAPDPASVPSMREDAHLLRERGVPAEEREDFRALYRAVVGHTDELVGELLGVLEASGRAEGTLVVFHSDHGEEFWEHGGWFHGQGHHAELIAFPLLFRFPERLPRGVRIAGDFRGVDVMPTVLDLVGLWGPEEQLEGQSLAAALRGQVAPARPALSEAPLFGPLEAHAVTRWPWRLIVTAEGPPQLYAVDRDPGEREDLAGEKPELVAELLRLGASLRQRAAARRRGAAAPLLVDERTRRELGAMGYLGGDE